jgi:putative phosphoribosyl transferase
MDTSLPFRNREDAARQLAAALAGYRGAHPVVLAIPRGAVPMGRLIADALDGELDVILVRKLGAPDNPEFAIGAIDERGQTMLDDASAEWAGASRGYVQQEAERQLALIRERRQRYRGGRAGIALAGRTVIVVDDGLATGATMLAALRAARAQQPARLICAVPVAARDSLAQVARVADEVVSLATPSPFGAVGYYYREFDQVDDAAVAAALAATPANDAPPLARASSLAVQIRAEDAMLPGDLVSPQAPQALVIFAHGSGSSRLSARNRFVAEVLNRRGFATLLFDLLTPQEDRDRALRFDIPLLTRRLQAALGWARRESGHRELPIALYGASTGAAAALAVAAARPRDVAAVISRGGRPDLAGREALARVRAPTLLIVGGADPEVLQLNRAAQAILGGRAELVVVPGATHLFEEPGTLEQVAVRSADWLARILASTAPPSHGA